MTVREPSDDGVEIISTGRLGFESNFRGATGFDRRNLFADQPIESGCVARVWRSMTSKLSGGALPGYGGCR
jgi:hypothetical protein